MSLGGRAKVTFSRIKLHTAGRLPGSCCPAPISPFDQTTLD